MGEYLLYYNDILFDEIYDNNLLVKIVIAMEKIICKNKCLMKVPNRCIWLMT